MYATYFETSPLHQISRCYNLLIAEKTGFNHFYTPGEKSPVFLYLDAYVAQSGQPCGKAKTRPT